MKARDILDSKKKSFDADFAYLCEHYGREKAVEYYANKLNEDENQQQQQAQPAQQQNQQQGGVNKEKMVADFSNFIVKPFMQFMNIYKGAVGEPMTKMQEVMDQFKKTLENTNIPQQGDQQNAQQPAQQPQADQNQQPQQQAPAQQQQQPQSTEKQESAQPQLLENGRGTGFWLTYKDIKLKDGSLAHCQRVPWEVRPHEVYISYKDNKANKYITSDDLFGDGDHSAALFDFNNKEWTSANLKKG